MFFEDAALRARVSFTSYFIEELLIIRRPKVFAYAKLQFLYIADFLEVLLDAGSFSNNFAIFLHLTELLIPCNIRLIQQELAIKEKPTIRICSLLLHRTACLTKFMTAANLKQKLAISNSFALKLIELGLFDE